MYFNLTLPKGLPSFPPPKVSRPVRARLDPHRHDPRHTHSRSTALAQLMTTEYEAARDAHLNHIYHPVTGTKETYDSLRRQNPVKILTDGKPVFPMKSVVLHKVLVIA